jgi:hypothetical protein
MWRLCSCSSYVNRVTGREWKRANSPHPTAMTILYGNLSPLRYFLPGQVSNSRDVSKSPRLPLRQFEIKPTTYSFPDSVLHVLDVTPSNARASFIPETLGERGRRSMRHRSRSKSGGTHTLAASLDNRENVDLYNIMIFLSGILDETAAHKYTLFYFILFLF